MALSIRPLSIACAVALGAAVAHPARAGELEVLHWYTSPGESRAIKAVADAFGEGGGHKWVDTAIAGGPGPGLQLTMSRIAAGDPPGAIQVSIGSRLRSLAEQGLLGDISDVAKQGNWTAVLPQTVSSRLTYSGKVVAVPLLVHGANWMWFNRKALERAKVAEPKNWDELMVAAEKLKAAGILPFATSSQSWQVSWLFTQILAGVGGRAVYEQYAAGDKAAFQSPAMLKSIEILQKIRSYADDSAANRAWNANANLVLNEKAAFFLMGDFAKPELAGGGKSPSPTGGDVGCMLTPGTSDFYMIVSDSLAMPAGVKGDVPNEQKHLARVVMSPKVQRQFALAKGSLPARTDVDLDGFDDCAKLGHKALTRPNGSVPATAMAFTTEVNGAVNDVLAKFWSQPTVAPKQLAESLYAAIERAK